MLSSIRHENTSPTASTTLSVSQMLRERDNLKREILIQHQFIKNLQQTHNEIVQQEKCQHKEESLLFRTEIDRLIHENTQRQEQIELLLEKQLFLEKQLAELAAEKEQQKAEFLETLKAELEEGKENRKFYTTLLKQKNKSIQNLTASLDRSNRALERTQEALQEAQENELALLAHLAQQHTQGKRWLFGGLAVSTSSVSGILLGALGIVTSIWNPLSWVVMATGLVLGLYCFYQAKKDYEALPSTSKNNQGTSPASVDLGGRQEARAEPSPRLSPRVLPQTSLYSSANPCLFQYYNDIASGKTTSPAIQNEEQAEPESEPNIQAPRC